MGKFYKLQKIHWYTISAIYRRYIGIQYRQITEDILVCNICQLMNIHGYTISTNYRRYMGIQYLQITEDTWVYNICQLLNIHWYTISTNYRRYIGTHYLSTKDNPYQYLSTKENTLVTISSSWRGHNDIQHTSKLFGKHASLWCMEFNDTFNYISVISWRSVLLVEETGVPGENPRPVASHWQNVDALRHW